jgi:prepilin-type N-terminal cleavage/methylation domain-containing protein
MLQKIITSKKKGMTLIEMMIAIAIFTMGMVGFSLLFAQSWKSNSFIIEENVASAQAYRSVNTITSELREIRQSATGEYMIKTATSDELVVYVDDDKDGTVERVRFFIDGSSNIFKKGVAKPVGSPLAYPANYSADIITNLALYVVNEEQSEPLFKYFNSTNTQLGAPARPTEIRVIDLNLWVNIKPLSAPDNVRIGTSVEIRNLDESI